MAGARDRLCRNSCFCLFHAACRRYQEAELPCGMTDLTNSWHLQLVTMQSSC